MGKTISHIKYKDSEAYESIVDYDNKYVAEGSSMTAAYNRINALKSRKFNVEVWHNN